jgi:ATP-dependent RNA helicase DDX10/DBP4
MHLHGKQKQMTRLAMFNKFTKTKHAVLFATDIAARGLDFPAVDWVVQVDCPEDAETYIHRVGRTARYESSGKAFLFLMPSEEEGMLAALKTKNIEVNKIKIKANKQQSIENQLQNLAFQDSEIKYLGQRVRRRVATQIGKPNPGPFLDFRGIPTFDPSPEEQGYLQASRSSC